VNTRTKRTVALSCIPASHAKMSRPIITRHRDHYAENTPQSFSLKKFCSRFNVQVTTMGIIVQVKTMGTTY